MKSTIFWIGTNNVFVNKIENREDLSKLNDNGLVENYSQLEIELISNLYHVIELIESIDTLNHEDKANLMAQRENINHYLVANGSNHIF